MTFTSNPLRIAFDSYWLDDGPPSGTNVVTSQIETWASVFPSDQIQLWGSSAQGDRTRSLTKLSNIQSRPRRLRQHGLSNLLELGRVKCDVVLSQNFAPLRTRGLSAVFFHDAIFSSHPEWFSRAERTYLNLAAQSLSRADLVFTSSEAEARRIAAEYPRVEGKIHSIGLGLSREFERANPARPNLPLDEGGFILVVGRLNVRKNLRRLQDALLKDGTISKELPLVVVGAADGVAGASMDVRTQRAVSDGAILYAGFLPDSELKWLYQHCRLFTFPSLDEGFGMPILEALSCGAPMALSDIPAFREFGDVARFFDPADEDHIRDVVVDALASVGDRPGMSPVRTWESSVATARNLVVNALTGSK